MYEILVSGMTCGGCVKSVTNAIKSLNQDLVVNVNLEKQLVSVSSLVDSKDITHAIEEAGFDVLEVKSTK